MVESESFIKEVIEEVKRDRLFKALNKFKWPLFAIIVLLVGAVGGYEYYKFDKKSRAQKNGEFLISAIESLKENGQTVTEKIDNEFTSVLIKLNEAKYFKKGDMKSASPLTITSLVNTEKQVFRPLFKVSVVFDGSSKSLGDVKKIKILMNFQLQISLEVISIRAEAISICQN